MPAATMRTATAAATALLETLPVCVSRLSSADLDALVPVVDRLAAVASAARFTLAGEAQTRGDIAASASGSLRSWVGERCPSLDEREVGTLAKGVRELAAPELEPARTAVSRGDLSVAAGVVLASELAQLRPLIEPGAETAVLAGLVSVGATHGCAGVRGLRPALLARYGLGRVIQEEQDRRAGLTRLTCGHDIGGGITEYRMRLTPESRAVVEAALDTLSRPAASTAARSSTGPPTGPVDPWERDPRSIEQRRGDALVEVCRRFAGLTSSSAASGDSSASSASSASTGWSRTDRFAGPVPGGSKATVLVTIAMDDLRTRGRPGTVLGRLDHGALLGPETVRKMTCDGAVIPTLLDTDGHPLRLGRTRRLFTPAQTRALWLRDRHCTYPGCTTPASWCDAHHIRHWADGGPTDLENAALLCGRHHTLVHRDRLAAAVTPAGVVWDRIPGSDDRAPPG